VVSFNLGHSVDGAHGAVLAFLFFREAVALHSDGGR